MTSAPVETQRSRRANKSLVHDAHACRAARIRAGLTGVAAAKQVGISQSFLSEIERGVRSVARRPHLLRRMASVYGVEIEELEAQRSAG